MQFVKWNWLIFHLTTEITLQPNVKLSVRVDYICAVSFLYETLTGIKDYKYGDDANL